MYRNINQHLLNWKNGKHRKVLLVRGARQIGKTYSIRELGKSFDNFLEINFEEYPEVKLFFNQSLNPFELLEKLTIYFNHQIIPGKTLLFFDEIQSCPDALKSLRFFYEKIPDLHVIAAGSLLELLLSEIPSFGVGRIESLYMYPMNFNEFLIANNSEISINLISSSSPDNPLDPVIHNKLIEQVRTFQIIGGLPEVVKTYIQTKNLLLCQKILDGILSNFFDDFAKYKERSPVDKLTEVFKSIVYQSGNKFKYSNISNQRSSTYKLALDILIKAGLAYKIYHTSARGLPLGAQIDQNKFKISPFDTGIYQRLLGLDLSQVIISDYPMLINRGSLVEIFTANEIISVLPSNIRPELYYWHREKRASNAEVDYVISINGKIIPIEVKSGTKGQMQSMNLFLEERKLDQGLRISGENFNTYNKITVIPVYAVFNIFKYPFIIQ